MLTIAAFLVALGLLIAVHEYGHYRMARWCGVKVLRFSVGFGKPLVRWTPKGSETDFVLGAFPLGGYVKMLDEREAPVPSAERHLAFNTQPLGKRAAIVAAGPMANLGLAILLYAVVNWTGFEQARPILASPVSGSLADRAGLKGGELIAQAGLQGEELKPLQSFDDLRWVLTRGALDARDVLLEVDQGSRRQRLEVVLKLSQIETREIDAGLFRQIGLIGPLTAPVIGELMADGAAARAGLHQGDVVLKMGSLPVIDGQQLRELIRSAVLPDSAASGVWLVQRGDAEIQIEVKPGVVIEGGRNIGRIGAFVGAPPQMATIHYGFVDGLVRGTQRTGEISLLTLKMMGRMLVGEASVKNLSGPLTIADFAGKSASMGLTQYLLFLALISVSLGVLNLLPLPVLDGGHLMYYLWEAATGKVVSDAWMERLQRGGVAVLTVMMSIAIYNDLNRLLG